MQDISKQRVDRILERCVERAGTDVEVTGAAAGASRLSLRRKQIVRRILINFEARGPKAREKSVEPL